MSELGRVLFGVPIVIKDDILKILGLIKNIEKRGWCCGAVN